MHDLEGSRQLAKETISEVYDATEGIDNDMFADACALVNVLGKMMKRGLGASHTPRTGSSSATTTQGTPTRTEKATAALADARTQAPPPGMI